MGHHTLQGNPPITVALRRSGRARRLSLRFSRLDGKVTLTLPHHASEREAIVFLKERENWLRGHLSDLRPVQDVTVGSRVPVAGLDRPIRVVPGKRTGLDADGFVVGSEESAGRKVKALLKTMARDQLAGASDDYAAVLGRSYSRIAIRDTRSRWGSCSTTGTLSYSWRLIMAPPDVLHYVAAHEVAHLQEMNHSPAFWAVVERLYGDHRAPRRWLRENGDQLHRINFGD